MSELQRFIEADASPAAKRKVLLKIGKRAEYMPHQGKKEMARRIKQLSRNK